MKIEDEALKRAIKHKALKSGTKIDERQYFVQYNKVWYFVDFKDDNSLIVSSVRLKVRE